MSAASLTPDYEYVAYIDESGDQGLQKVKPLDPGGSSEWLIVSGVMTVFDVREHLSLVHPPARGT